MGTTTPSLSAAAVERAGRRPARTRRAWTVASRRTAVIAAAVVALPILAAVISVAGRSWYAAGDQALEVLRIRDVGGRHTPLVGTWSRFGWSHPGPALFYVLTPFYRVLGETGVLAGAGLINLGAAVGIVAIGHRRGGPRLAVLAALMVALVVRGLGPSLIIDPWNPWLALLPFLLFMLLVWSVTCGDRAMLPWAVLSGSLAVQSHAAYLPLVGGLLGLGVGWVVVERWRARPVDGSAPAGGGWRVGARPLVVAAGAGLVVWSPAFAQQLFGERGNLAALASYMRDPQEDAIGWAYGFGVFGVQLRPDGPWLTGRGQANLVGWASLGGTVPALVVTATAALLGWWAWRRGATSEARLVMVALAGTALAVLATARATGFQPPYVLHWWRAVAAVVWLSIAWTLLGATARVSARVADGVAAGAVAATAVVGCFTLAGLPAPLPLPLASEGIAHVAGPTAEALDPCARYLVEGFDSAQLGAATSGLYLELLDRGLDVFAIPFPGADLQFGPWRLATPADVDAVVTIVSVPDLDVWWHPPPGSRQLIEWDPLSPAQRARARELAATVRELMGPAAPPGGWIPLGTEYSRGLVLRAGASPADVAELRELEEQGPGYAVDVSPGSAATGSGEPCTAGGPAG